MLMRATTVVQVLQPFAGLVLCFIAYFILLVIAPLFRHERQELKV